MNGKEIMVEGIPYKKLPQRFFTQKAAQDNINRLRDEHPNDHFRTYYDAEQDRYFVLMWIR